MAADDQGPRLMAVLWALTGIVFIFLLMRIYTRVICVASYGADDHFFMIAFEKGSAGEDLDEDAKYNTIFWRDLGQSNALVATAAAKASVGFFMIRLVIVRWQKVLISMAMGALGATCIRESLSSAKFAVFRRRRKLMNLNPQTVGTVFIDLLFAVLPWNFVWKLNMSRKDKLIIAGSLSLGLLAAVAGIIRITYVRGVREVDYDVIIWSQVEIAVTMICVSIPVCRPLWSRTIGNWFTNTKRRNSGYVQQDEPRRRHGDHSVGLRTIGGTPMFGARVTPSSKPSKKSSHPSATNLASFDSKTYQYHQHHHQDDDGTSDQRMVKDNSSVAPTRDTPSVTGEQVDSARINKDWILGNIGTEVQAHTIESEHRTPPLAGERGIMSTKTFHVHRS
ncbi:hypothetical protein PG988_013741 [Apiospora saccharicola]